SLIATMPSINRTVLWGGDEQCQLFKHLAKSVNP
ncbi:MAG: hypothetical protein ACI8VY_001240, partial [Cellvibrionaceae bacterium]